MTSISAESYRGLARKPSKYKNVKTVVDGMAFDSNIEAERYIHLRDWAKRGVILDLRCQVRFELAPSVVINSRKRPALRYVADFVYLQVDGNRIVEDVKGAITDAYRIKRHLMKSVHGIDIHEYRKPTRKLRNE